MCYGCLKEYGGASRSYPVNDLGLRSDLERLQECHITGGPLHVIVEDMNLDDDYFPEVPWSLEHDHDDYDTVRCSLSPSECVELCRRIVAALSQFDEADRSRIVYDAWRGSGDDSPSRI